MSSKTGDSGCTAGANRDLPDMGSFTGSPGYRVPNAKQRGGTGPATIRSARRIRRTKRGVSRWATGCDSGSVERGGYNDITVNANTNNSPDTVCTFSEAITSANNNSNSSAPGCASGVADSAAHDLITLTLDVELTAAPPNISSTMIIEGGGHTLKPTSGNLRLIPTLLYRHQRRPDGAQYHDRRLHDGLDVAQRRRGH